MKNFIKALIPYFKRYKKQYFAGLFGLLVASSTQLAIPNLIQQILDTIHEGVLQSNFSLESIMPSLLAMLGVALVTAFARWSWRFWLHGASRSIEADLRQLLFQKYLRLGMQDLQKGSVGDFLARATNDIQAMRMATSMGLVASFDGIFMTVAILIILIAQNSELAFVVVAPLPVITLIVLTFGSRIGRLSGVVQEGYAAISTKAQETFSNIRVVQTFGIENYLTKKFAETNQEYQERNVRLARVSGLMHPLIGFVSGTSIVLLLYFGGRLMLEGQLSPGQFTALLVYLQMLIWPMLGAGFTVNILQRGAAAWTRVKAILDAPDEFDATNKHYERFLPPLNITFDSVSASYEAGKILDKISFSFHSRSWIGVTGPTGSGKTSLVKLLLRFLEPSSGKILFDNVDVQELDPYAVRGLFAYVPQEGFLFSRSLLENIAFGEQVEEKSPWKIEEIVEFSGLEGDLPQFADGLETEIGEKGVMVSGGQKQRISYARALLSNAPILIVDDGLSALDSRTETKVLDHLARIREGKTTILVSQRIRELARCNKVAVIENGRLSAFDTPQNLARKSGFYRDTAGLQEYEDSEAGE